MTHAQPQKKSVFNMNVDLMHGPILKSLLLFMLPILISNLFQQLYNTVDAIIVGNFVGTAAGCCTFIFVGRCIARTYFFTYSCHTGIPSLY